MALFGVTALAYATATALCGIGVPASVRFAVGLIGLLVVQYLLGLSLIAAGLFGGILTWLLACCAMAALGILLRPGRHRQQLAADGAALRKALQSTSCARLAALGLPLLLVWLQAARGAVTPPLDWDFLTYHGPRAAFWLQESKIWPSYDAVGYWQYYRAFPPAGDLITAWAMSASHDDLLVAPTWTGIWMGLGLTSYAVARALGGGRWESVLAGIAVALLPAAFQHMSSGYVDNAVALCAIAGTACLAEAERRRSAELASIGLAGFAAAAAMKQTSLPFLGIALGLGLRQLLVSRRELRAWLVAGASLVALVTALLWYAMLALREGNPLYPFPVEVFGFSLPGAREAIPAGVGRPRLDFLDAGKSLFYMGFFGKPWLHNNFGLGGLVLMVAAFCTLLLRRRPTGLVAPALLVGGLGLLTWVMASRIGEPGLDEARYMITVAALAASVVAASALARARHVLAAAIGVNLVYALPWRWAEVDIIPMGAIAIVGLAVGAGALLTRRKSLALGLGMLASIGCAAELRALLRWDYYRAAAEGQIMASGPIAFCPSSHAHRIWRELAVAPSLTIDVSAGNHPLMTNWFIYPLLGNRLQHRLVHVRTGLHFPKQQADASEAELDVAASSWADGLQRAGAQAVVLYKPYPIEAQLARRVSASFDTGLVDTLGATLLPLR